MVKIDNDETKGVARPFVVAAQRRSGGTLLSHFLSNHPDIHCDRGEALHHLSIWRTGVFKKIGVAEITAMLLSQEGYFLSGFRGVYNQVLHKDVWRVIEDKKAKLIWLTRGDKISQAMSIVINATIRKGKAPYRAVHSFERQDDQQYKVSPDKFIYWLRRIKKEDDLAIMRISKSNLSYLALTYEDLLGGEVREVDQIDEKTGRRICEFLDVRYLPMTASLKKIYRRPPSRVLSNWTDVRDAIAESEFRSLLEE